MGAGKSTVSEKVNLLLPESAYLDGDWCWKLNPFVVNDETKKMVLSNIHFLLNAFIHNFGTNFIIFSWVMDEDSIIQDVLSQLDLKDVETFSVSLVPSSEKLTRNLKKDIEFGIREKSIISDSLARIQKYESVNSIQIDTSNLEVEDIAIRIIQMVKR